MDLNGDGRDDFVYHRWINPKVLQEYEYDLRVLLQFSAPGVHDLVVLTENHDNFAWVTYIYVYKRKCLR